MDVGQHVIFFFWLQKPLGGTDVKALSCISHEPHLNRAFQFMLSVRGVGEHDLGRTEQGMTLVTSAAMVLRYKNLLCQAK